MQKWHSYIKTVIDNGSKYYIKPKPTMTITW